MQTIHQINANLVWYARRDGQRCVGWCDALKLTAEGDTWSEMVSVITELHNEVFADLAQEGELEQFLQDRGWTHVAGQVIAGAPVAYDVPFQLMEEAAA